MKHLLPDTDTSPAFNNNFHDRLERVSFSCRACPGEAVASGGLHQCRIPHSGGISAASERYIFRRWCGGCLAGVPDLGTSTLDDVLTDVRRIPDSTELPLLVDADPDWRKRIQYCSHGKVVDQIRRGSHAYRGSGAGQALRTSGRQALVKRGRNGGSHQGRGGCANRSDFVIMARTDALAGEGVQ